MGRPVIERAPEVARAQTVEEGGYRLAARRPLPPLRWLPPYD
jgi:hypothetical protein